MPAKVLFKSNNGFVDIPSKLTDNKKWAFFDLDGTLVDSENINYDLYREVINKMHGVEITYNEWKIGFTGRRPQDSIPNFLKQKGITAKEFNFNEFVTLAKPIKDDYVFNKLLSNSNLIFGAKDYLFKLKMSGCKLLLTTSTVRIYAESILKQYNIKDIFEHIITGDDVSKGKPNSQVYLLALRKSNASPGETIVFEDSKSGVESALAAGLDCVQISTDNRQ